jgi:Tol biopolymer transport system component
MPPSNRQLYHAQTSCLVSQAFCPAGLVSGFPQPEDNPLAWSPDGQRAALISSATSELLIYSPQTQAWSTVLSPINATLPIALWSPDSDRFATTVQGTDTESSLLTLIHPESAPNAATTQTPAAELGDMQVPLGWLNADELLFMRYRVEPKGQQGETIEPRLYRVVMGSGTIEELPFANGWEWLKSYPAPSPDGSRIALSLPNGDHSELAIADLSGTEEMFFGVNGQMPAWSPDGEWLAYIVQQVDSVEVYTSRRDGADQRKVFEWGSYPSFTWSPDSQYLLITAYPGGGASSETDASAFYMYSLADREMKEIRLAVDSAMSDLLAPSFQPLVKP